jgi:hypothetical protein
MDVVFIHLGPCLPVFFWDTLRQTRRFHSGRLLCVIPETALKASEVDQFGVEAYSNRIWEQASAIQSIRKVSRLTRHAQSGFWQFALERLFILAELMRLTGLRDALHLENDVTIYTDPEAMATAVRKAFGPRSCAVVPSAPQEGCTAAVMYAGSSNALDEVCSCIIRLLELGESKLLKAFPSEMVNEMSLLGLVQLRNPELLRSFPITPSEGECPTMVRFAGGPLRQFYRITDRLCPQRATDPPHGLSAELDTFQSLFDPSSWGQYLGGTPNGHAPGVAFPHHWLGPDLAKGRFEVEWHLDEQWRRVPYVIDRYHENRRWRLNNLHVHCKRIVDFI